MNEDKEILKCQNSQSAVIDIMMQTYNHENYIKQALDSILMQKTEYSYRILIGEDCSTDDTRKIVVDYYQKFPDKIEVILWKKNAGALANDLELMSNCKAKYVASLEGDDYWTSPYKLQKQVSFLEEHSDYIGTAHNVRCVDENGELLHRDFNSYPIVEEHVYGRAQAMKLAMISQTASMVYRNVYEQWDKTQWDFYKKSNINGDQVGQVFLGMQGNVYFFRDIMADHRKVFHGDSWTARSAGKNKLAYSYRNIKRMQLYLHKRYDVSFVNDNLWKDRWEISKKRLLSDFNIENLRVCGRMLWLKRWENGQL